MGICGALWLIEYVWPTKSKPVKPAPPPADPFVDRHGRRGDFFPDLRDPFLRFGAARLDFEQERFFLLL